MPEIPQSRKDRTLIERAIAATQDRDALDALDRLMDQNEELEKAVEWLTRDAKNPNVLKLRERLLNDEYERVPILNSDPDNPRYALRKK